MRDTGISESVVRFINDHISSIAQLEIVLLIGAQRGAALPAETVARELRIDPGWTASNLKELAAKGILVERSGVPPVYAFAPESAELDHTLAAVATAYNERRLAVTDLIFNKPGRIFADAFRFRKD